MKISRSIPEIRFGKFTKKWSIKKIADISNKVTEKNKENRYLETFTNSAEHGIVSQKDFFDKEISNVKNIDGYYVVRPDDFVYNPRISNYAPVGPIKKNNLNKIGVMSPLYYVFRPIDISSVFLEKYFETSYWHQFMKLNGDSGARADRFAIKDSTFKQMPIPYPESLEQVKIGSFFLQLDESINLQQHELTLLKQRKKAFLQKMFPKKGERLPENRFSKYNEDWHIRQFDELVERVSEKSNSSSLPKVEFEDIISGEGRLNKDISKKTDDRTGIYFESQFILYGKLRPYLNNWLFPDFKGVALGDFWVFKSNDYSSIFIYYLIQTSKYQKAANLSSGTKMPRSDWNTVSKTNFKVPLDINEQNQIGNFFKQLDEDIALHEQKLEKLKEMKKAFLQKMFV